jgi:anaerobic selenocysteine-containing dehydrogenase
MSELPSVCPLDCPDTCSLTVTVENDQVIKVRGSDANPVTNGVVCNKVARYFPEFVHEGGRLITPMRRTGPKGSGAFEPISWDDALDLVYDNFTDIIKEHGPQAVMPLNYAGPHGMLAGGSMDLRFFHRLGASLLWRRPMCGGIKSEAFQGTFGSMPAMQPEQIVHAKLIVVWGNNVTVSNLHLAPLIKKARAAGAKLVVIDPKKIKIADQADMYLPVMPGADIVLAWAIANELKKRDAFDQAFIDAHVQGADAFMAEAEKYTLDQAAEICGIPAEDITAFATLYANSNPATLAIGNGLERNQNGGNGVRAILALPALTNKFGVIGGGILGGSGHLFPKTSAKLTRPDLVPEGTRTINILDVGRHLDEDDLDVPIKGVFIYNHNPVIVAPDQNQMKRGLSREDIFVVGCDITMTDSMKYADVILPAATHFEYDDIYCAYGQPYVQRATPVIPTVGEALPNTEIFRRLAARFGFNEALFKASDKDLIDEALDGTDPRFNGVRPRDMPSGEAISMEKELGQVVLFENTFPKTPSGKIELSSSYLAEKYDAEIPVYIALEGTYPLGLVTPSSDKLITSTFGGVAANQKTPDLEMHPDDATERGLSDGVLVKVFNDLGEVFLPLKITKKVRPGVLYSPKGAWFVTTENQQTVSALAPTTKADLCEGACYNDTRVEVVSAA